MAIDLNRLDILWGEFVNENRFDPDFDPNSDAAKTVFFATKVPETMPTVRRVSQSGTPGAGLTTAQQFGTGYQITPSDKWGDLVTMGDPGTVYIAPRDNEFAKFLKAAGLAFGTGAGLTALFGPAGFWGSAAGAGEAGMGGGALDFAGVNAADLAMEIAPGMTVAETAGSLTAAEQAAIASNFGGGFPGASSPAILDLVRQYGPNVLKALPGMMDGGGGGGGGRNPLLDLLGVGSGLYTMFGGSPAVDPSRVNALWQAGQNTYNTSLDPQGELYKRTQQQVQEQTRAAQSARGIAMSPYGAGIEDQAMRDCNINWANEQLRRQVAGTGAFAGAGNVAANAGIANNAQAFLQNQTGLNNLTTGLAGTQGGMSFDPVTGTWKVMQANPGLLRNVGSWLNNMWGGGSNITQAVSDLSQMSFQPGGANYGYIDPYSYVSNYG